jgi:hypothetical protein
MYRIGRGHWRTMLRNTGPQQAALRGYCHAWIWCEKSPIRDFSLRHISSVRLIYWHKHSPLGVSDKHNRAETVIPDGDKLGNARRHI